MEKKERIKLCKLTKTQIFHSITIFLWKTMWKQWKSKAKNGILVLIIVWKVWEIPQSYFVESFEKILCKVIGKEGGFYIKKEAKKKLIF